MSGCVKYSISERFCDIDFSVSLQVEGKATKLQDWFGMTHGVKPYAKCYIL